MFVRRYKRYSKKRSRKYMKKNAKSGQSFRRETFFFTFGFSTLDNDRSHHEEKRILENMRDAKPWKALRQLYDQFKINYIKTKLTWQNCDNTESTYKGMILAQMAIDPTKSADDAKSVVASDYEDFHQQRWNKTSPSLNRAVVASAVPKTLSGQSLYRSTEDTAKVLPGSFDPILIIDLYAQGVDLLTKAEAFQVEVEIHMSLRGLRYKSNVLLLPQGSDGYYIDVPQGTRLLMGPDGMPVMDPLNGQTPTVYYTKPAPQEFIQISTKQPVMVGGMILQPPIDIQPGETTFQAQLIDGQYHIVNGVRTVIAQQVQPGQFITYSDGNNDGNIDINIDGTGAGSTQRIVGGP